MDVSHIESMIFEPFDLRKRLFDKMRESTESLHDEILVLRSQQGQSDAFEELVRRWQKRLWARAFRVTRDAEASWDIVQDTWRKTIQALPKLEMPAAFPGWVLRMTNNLCIDWIRREVRRREIHESFAETIPKSVSDDAPWLLSDVHVALSRLERDDCQIITLYYFDEMAVGEIADLLDIPAGTVKSRLHYAREKLKHFLEEER